MSHTWQPKSWRAQQRIRHKKRQIIGNKPSFGRRFTAEDVRELVAQMRQKEQPTGELRYVAAGGEV